MLLDFKRKIYRKSWSIYNDDVWNEHSVRTTSYVYGFNNDGLLFVNRIDSRNIFDYATPQLIAFKDNITIYSVNDVVIHKILGYDYDVGELSEITVSDSGSYRVQGEIVLNVKVVNSIEDYYKRIINDLEDQLRGYVHIIILDVIMSILLSLRFNVSLHESETGQLGIALIDIRRRGDNIESKLRYIAYEILENLKTFMEIDSYRVDIDFSGNIRDIIIRSRYYGEFIINFVLSRIPFNSKYGDVYIRLILNRDGLIMEELKTDLYNQLRRLQKSRFNHVIGNHKIVITNALSSEITYTPPIRTQIISTTPIRLSSNYYYVDSESEITITHNEHGITKIKFTKPMFIMFTTTNIDLSYAGECNRVLLDILARKWSYRSFKLVYQN
jgi:hypothetical protein